MSELLRTLEPQVHDPRTVRFINRGEGERGIVFGGHVLAQVLVGASTAIGDRRIVAAHVLFGRPVSVDSPTEVRLDVAHLGRRFGSLSATVWQGDRERARSVVMVATPGPDLVRHAIVDPVTSEPPASGDGIHVVGGDAALQRTAPDRPEVDAWCRHDLPEEVPAGLHEALVARSSAAYLVAASMLPHEGLVPSMAHREVSTGVLAHSISFHEQARADRWHHIRSRARYAGQGRAHGTGTIVDQDGCLVASFSQEGLLAGLDQAVTAAKEGALVL